MTHRSQLQSVPLFAGLPEEDLDRIAQGATERSVEPGTLLFREGESGDKAYVIESGEIEIVKQALNREVLLAVQGPGSVIGEMALLQEAPRMATGRARATATVLEISRATLDYVLDTSPAAARTMMNVVLDRWRENQAQLHQSERMAQLGTLTAGLAHELNNPAAAVARSAEALTESIAAHSSAYAAAVSAIEPAETDRLQQLISDSLERSARPADLDPLTRSDREGEIEDWLVDRSIEPAWQMAPALVDLGVDQAELEGVAASFGNDALAAVVGALVTTQTVGSLLHEVQEGAGRLSAIVKALKSYAYLDKAPVQDVVVTTGIDDTLLILKRKLDGVTIRKEYDPNLPTIEAYGSELNQVWTNLIDNAADALRTAGTEAPVITIRAFPVADGITIEVEDNGPGIPEEIRSRVFDSFFTTKPPGSGTGLGLDISRSIVMTRHGGNISVDSEPGRTTFRVELPLRPPA